jgi:TM2 domain-containing membrane protein YozV
MDAFFTGLFLLAVIFGVMNLIRNKDADKDVKTVTALPPSVQNVVTKMDANTQNAFFTEYNRSKKSVGLSYLLWFVFGLHYAYNKKIGLQFVYWFTLGAFFIWAFIDLFRMPSIVKDANSIIAREISNTLALGNTFKS